MLEKNILYRSTAQHRYSGISVLHPLAAKHNEGDVINLHLKTMSKYRRKHSRNYSESGGIDLSRNWHSLVFLCYLLFFFSVLFFFSLSPSSAFVNYRENSTNYSAKADGRPLFVVRSTDSVTRRTWIMRSLCVSLKTRLVFREIETNRFRASFLTLCVLAFRILKLLV